MIISQKLWQVYRFKRDLIKLNLFNVHNPKKERKNQVTTKKGFNYNPNIWQTLFMIKSHLKVSGLVWCFDVKVTVIWQGFNISFQWNYHLDSLKFLLIFQFSSFDRKKKLLFGVESADLFIIDRGLINF